MILQAHQIGVLWHFMKLPKTQQELLDAMHSGVICHYMPYAGRLTPHPYYFRNDTMKHCTAPATALLKKGLVEIYDKERRGHKLRAVTKTDL